MEYQVLLEKKAIKQVRSLDPEVRIRIASALELLTEGFSARLDIKKLKGVKDQYRIRVGNYRILFALAQNRRIIVFAVLPREKAYE